MRPAGRVPRRPDRRRPRRARGPRGRRGDPGVQRRLPGPAAAAHADRGHRDDRGAAGAARRRGRRRPARSSTGPWPSSRPPRPRVGAPRIDPGDDGARADTALLARRLRGRRRTRAAPGPADLLRAVPRRAVRAGRRPSRRRHAPTGFAYLDAWCHSAEAPRLFRLDRIQDAEVLDTPVTTAAEAAAGPRPTGSSAAPRTPRWSRCGWPRRPAGSSSTTRSRRCGPGRRRSLEVDLLVADERWLPAACCSGSRRTPGWSSPRSSPTRSSPRRAGALGLYVPDVADGP